MRPRPTYRSVRTFPSGSTTTGRSTTRSAAGIPVQVEGRTRWVEFRRATMSRMGNSISDGDATIRMSNGLATVVCHVIGLSGSALADTASQRGIAREFLARAELCSRGVGDFELGELPWVSESFLSDRDFLVAALEDAATGHRWHLLGYEPHREWTLDRLAKLDAMVRSFAAPAVFPESNTDDDRKCVSHEALLVDGGCVICEFERTLIG